mmetsp:Transcript_8423/g.35215  ORF Transcript_8423/g.35215 Transcript_8423/m.35215 type:complete len:321 (-) Transcript_8423:48-1010(-)
MAFTNFEYSYSTVTSASCYVADTPFDIVFGILLAIGVWISWLPQQVEFAMKKSTFGVSSLYVILTQVANWTPFINALYLDHDTFKCCTYISFWECQESLIAVYQLGISVFSVVCIHILYVVFYTPTEPAIVAHELGWDDEIDAHAPPGDLNTAPGEAVEVGDGAIPVSKEYVKQARRKQLIFFVLFNLLVAVCIAAGFIFMWITYPYSPLVVWYSYGLSAIGVLAVLFQFTPQIYMTYKIKERGSLSIVMLLIQTPGTWIWLLYLVADGQNWSTWISTLVAAVEVSILLCQVLWYDCFRKRFGKHAQVVEETEGLLQREE